MFALLAVERVVLSLTSGSVLTVVLDQLGVSERVVGQAAELFLPEMLLPEITATVFVMTVHAGSIVILFEPPKRPYQQIGIVSCLGAGLPATRTIFTKCKWRPPS
jgi:hypothetical protein